MITPDKQPPGGWVVKIKETGGTVKGKDFVDFCKKINDQLSANGHAKITPDEVFERMIHAED